MHSDTRPATPPRAAARLRRAALWAVRLALGAFFLMAGASKLVGAPDMIALFDEIGAGHWLRLLTGSVETAAAVMLLVPPVSALGAAALAGVVAGATATHLLVLERSPLHPLSLLAVAGLLLWWQRDRLPPLVDPARGRAQAPRPG